MCSQVRVTPDLYCFAAAGLSFFFGKDGLQKSGLHRLLGLVVKAFALGVADPGFDSHLRHGDFSGLSHTSDLDIGTPVATLPGTWHYIVSAGTGWPSVSIL